MGFIINNDQQRQRISISPETMIVLEQDVSDFNLDGLGELVNDILIYREKYNLTQDSLLKQYCEQTYSYLQKAGIDSDINDILEKLCDLKKKEIIERIGTFKTHKRGNIGKNIYIKQRTLRWLESPENTEDLYYGGSLLLYLNSVIEEYAQKDLYTRERIITNERVSKINAYIKDQEWVNVYWPNKRSVRFFPIKILPDKLNTHAYLACYTLSDDGALKPSSFRMSALPDDMQIAHGYNPTVTESDIKTIDELISERRIDFLAYTAEDIQVRLTKHGMKRYLRTTRLRPDIINSKDSKSKSTICTFHCTKQQAEYYFAQFGEDVEIISPQPLRERFIQIYQNALTAYNT